MKKNKLFLIIYNLLIKKWYIDRIYNEFISNLILNLGLKFFYKEVDRGFLEHFGPLGFINLIKKSMLFLKKVEKGSFFYILSIFYYFVCLIIFFYFFFYFFVLSIELFIFFLFLFIFFFQTLIK